MDSLGRIVPVQEWVPNPFTTETSYNNGLFTLHGTGTGTGIGNGTSTIGDNGLGSCPCLSAVWTVKITYRNPLILVLFPVPVPVPVTCSVNAPLDREHWWWKPWFRRQSCESLSGTAVSEIVWFTTVSANEIKLNEAKFYFPIQNYISC